MALFFLLLVWFISSTAADSNAHRLLPNRTHGFNHCGWHMRRDIGQSPHRFKRMGSGLLDEMKGSELLDTAYSNNEGQFPLIDIVNSSSMLLTGVPYSVSVAQDICSYERALTISSRNNEINMTVPYMITTHEYFANKNGQAEALKQGRLLNNEQAFDEVVGSAITTTYTMNYSDSMHQFAGEDDSIEISMNLITWELLPFAIIHLTCLGIMKLLAIIFKWISNHKRIIDCQGVRSVRNCFEFIFILILLTTTILAMSYIRSLNSMLNVKKLQRGTEDVTAEPGVFQNSSTNIVHAWNSKEGKEKNNLVSFEDFTRIVVEHSRSTKQVKNGKTDMKLRILVPTKNIFHEFVKVDRDPNGNGVTVTGYSVDVFKEVMDSLPYRVSYEFFPYEIGLSHDVGYYDQLIQQIHLNGYDGVLGDIRITSNRSKYGDFTPPYMMSGVSIIVPVDSPTNCLWWFLKPVTWGLWLLIPALFFSNGFVVWIFERKNNPEFEGTFSDQAGKTLSFFFSIFVPAERETLKSNYLRLVIYISIVGALLFGVSYTAMLGSMLTSDNKRSSVTTVEQLITNGDYVGYQKGSFVFDLLKHMGIQEQKLKAYSSKEDYAIALSRGSRNNGVSAIVDEIPYIKIFLAKYGDRYTMAGPTFRPGGFGFLFKRGCAVLLDVSTAVLKFIEGKKMHELEKK